MAKAHPKTDLTAAEVRRLLDYDPETGVLRWKVRPARCIFVGDVAGSLKKGGYRTIQIRKRSYPAHRLAWLYMKGAWPPRKIDHRNRNGHDNRWANLRLATDSQNAANAKRYATNTAGRKGVTWHKKCQRWQAAIKHNGRNIHLGLFDSVEEAHEAYCDAAREIFGEFWRAA